MMLLQFFVVLFIYPETKGVSLEEMQKKLVTSHAH
jgi:MFS transporter, SP family, arabinose:H+ symporter